MQLADNLYIAICLRVDCVQIKHCFIHLGFLLYFSYLCFTASHKLFVKFGSIVSKYLLDKPSFPVVLNVAFISFKR